MNRDDIAQMMQDTAGANWGTEAHFQRFAVLVAAAERKACIDIVETYEIPVGNSASSELACELLYAALREVRDTVKDRGAS